MEQPRPNPENLQSRYNILDILLAIMMPAFVASIWTVEKPEHRLIVFFPALALAGCSAWWSATLVHTFKIRKLGKRLATHVHAYLSFSAIVILIIAHYWLAEISTFPVAVRWGMYIFLMLSVPLIISIFVVEFARRKVEKSSIDESLGAAPIESTAATARTNLKQLIEAKKQER